jgi:GT2 family glycosyltransferase
VAGHFPEAKLVRSADNLGFAEANNMGLRYALDKGYDYAYLLNQDAWLEPSTLGTLVAASEAHPSFAVLSPLQMTDGFKELDPLFGRLFRVPGGAPSQNRRLATPPTKWAPPSYDAEGGTDSGRECPPETIVMAGEPEDVMPGLTGHLEAKPVRRVMAAHWLIPRKALETIGLFDPLFPLYGNDDNWCDRARYHGFKVGIVPQARAVHDRAYRQEPKEKVIYRNYFMGSLVRQCDINRPLWERFLFVCLFTLVKALKYRSFLPFKHFRTLCGMLPQVREARSGYRIDKNSI